jgi:hypothetical protein
MIILPTKKPVSWDSTDAGILQIFFETPVGQKVLTILHGRIPGLLEGGELNKVLIRSGQVAGAQMIFDSLVSLIVEIPVELQQIQKTEDSYPSLDDSQAWEKFDNEQPR